MAESIIAHQKVTNRKLTNSTPIDVAIVDASGTQIGTFGGSGGTSAVDESAATPGTTQGTPAMGIFETVPTTLANNQVGLVGLTTDRRVKVSGTFSSTPITAGTSALSNVADSVASVTLLASNVNRLCFVLYNDSASAVFVKCGAVASATSFTKKMLPQEVWDTSDLGVNYTGVIDAIWVTAPGGAMRITELSA